MKSKLNTLTVFVTLVLFFLSQAVSAQYSKSTYLVVLDHGTPQSEIDELLYDYQSEEIWVSPISETRLWRVTVPFPFTTLISNKVIGDINETEEQVQEEAIVEGASLNHEAEADNTSTPPLLAWGSGYDYEMDCFGQLSTYIPNGPHSVDIAVFDTGLSYDPAFSAPGFYSDLSGYTEYDHLDMDNVAEDNNGHGTHMASIISHTARKGYTLGQTTNVPAETYDIRKTFDDNGVGYVGEIILAMEQAVQAGAQVLSCSWSVKLTREQGQSSLLLRSFDTMDLLNGVLVVAAAGNDNSDIDVQLPGTLKNFPAAYDSPYIISATTYDCEYELAGFANYGVNSVDIALPGQQLPGLVSPTGVYNNSGPGGLGANAGSIGPFGLTYSSGTSHSTALLAGVAANLGSYQATFDAEMIICAIMNTAIYHPNLDGKIKSAGIIDAQEALMMLLNNCTGPNPNGGGIGGIAEGRSRRITRVFPNPNIGSFSLEMQSSTDSEINITIMDSNGRLAYATKHKVVQGQNSIDLDAQTLSPGLYVLAIKGEEINESHKLVITK